MRIELFNHLYGAKPIAFYHYPHTVTYRIVSLSEDTPYNDKEKTFTREYHSLNAQLIKLFNDAGIKCASDNKIVFEVEYNGQHIFIGFYDWKISIGFGVQKI
jgi:hypothetical protein